METKIGYAMLDGGESLVVDTRLHFSNGRLYISKYPTINGKQSDFAEEMDVTDEIAEALWDVINKKKEGKT